MRTYRAWYRFMSARPLGARGTLRGAPPGARKKSADEPAGFHRSLAEVRRLLRGREAAEEQRTRLVWWSRFRRTLSAPARSGLTPSAAPAKLLLSHDPTRCRFPSRCLFFLCSPMLVFEQRRPLFEPEQPKQGRQTEQGRRRVEAVLWVARTASAWRQWPEDFGPWETVVYHSRRWCKGGLWERILQILLPPRASHVPPLALPAP